MSIALFSKHMKSLKLLPELIPVYDSRNDILLLLLKYLMLLYILRHVFTSIWTGAATGWHIDSMVSVSWKFLVMFSVFLHTVDLKNDLWVMYKIG